MMVACAAGNWERVGATDNAEEREVPPSWFLLVLSHQFHVNVRLFRGAVHVLLPDVFAVVQIRIYDE
jgi:hypothetical protein